MLSADVKGQLKKNSTGVLAQLAKKHEEALDPQDQSGEPIGCWIGGIPRHCITGEVGDPDATLDGVITQQLDAVGEVLSATVRVKDGENKSWCLCTFNLSEEAQRCVETGLSAPNLDGAPMPLVVRLSDVAGQGNTAGALASIAKKHDEEVEAARKLMRQVWDTMRSGDLMDPVNYTQNQTHSFRSFRSFRSPQVWRFGVFVERSERLTAAFMCVFSSGERRRSGKVGRCPEAGAVQGLRCGGGRKIWLLSTAVECPQNPGVRSLNFFMPMPSHTRTFM